MSLKDRQTEVDAYVQRFTVPYWEPLAIMARLTEEVGEVAREVNHQFGPKKKKANEGEAQLGAELADIIFTVICMANSQQIDLDRAFDLVMKKAYGRDGDRYEKKS